MSESRVAPAAAEPREVAYIERCLLTRRWSLVAALAGLTVVLAVALALFHLFVAAFGTPESRSFRSTHLTVMLALAVLLRPLFREGLAAPIVVPGDPRNALRVAGLVVDLALIALAFGIQVYVLWDVEALLAREGSINEADMVLGWLTIALVLEATRRIVGWTMVVITLFFVLQTLYADHFFGIFYGPPISFERFADIQFVRTEGIYGIPILVASTYITLFILFGAILIRSGAGRFFIDLAVALTGHLTGGPAKAAVVASAFLGTVSGSATANVVTTGSFTIPMMVRLGYRARFAAAVEACASSGGQITPPIMGAAAFIIAEFLRVPYLWVVAAAVIPTFLYFATVYFMVHLEAEKHGIARLPRAELPRLGPVLVRGWHLLLALVVLVAFLVAGFTPTLAAFWAIVSLVALTFVSPGTRMSPVDLLAALEGGIRSTVPVSVACACAGIIIGSIFVSGLGLKFTSSVIDLSGGSLVVLLVLTALAAIFLGMGITTTAVYITVAALIVPALVQSGVVPMAAHLFAFYYGVVSTITPPVALAAFAAAAIAGSPPMATAAESARIGIAKYLVPFIFVYNPSLLFEGPWWLTLYSLAAALIAVWGISVALEAWLKGPVPPALRAAVGLGALALIYPPALQPFGVSGYTLNAFGLAVVAAVWLMRRRPAEALG